MLKSILLSFIPIFVAMDAVAVLPIFLSLTQGIDKRDRNRIIIQSLITAACLAIGFIFLGKAVFRFLGISVADFMIAGGIILFCIAILDLINNDQRQKMAPSDIGAVPIGTPLIVGPAVLTTSLMIVDQYGMLSTFIAIVANIILTGIILFLSGNLLKFFGHAGIRALSKIMALLLASIAVMMIRKGIFTIITS